MNFIKKKGGKAHASLSLSFHSSKEFSFLNMEQGRCTICGKPASFHSSKEFSFLNGDITVTIDPTAECFHSSKEFSFLNKKDFEPLLSKCYWFPLLKGILIFKQLALEMPTASSFWRPNPMGVQILLHFHPRYYTKNCLKYPLFLHPQGAAIFDTFSQKYPYSIFKERLKYFL